MTHNGIDIDQFILLTVYPTITFFAIGGLAKRLNLSEPLKYGMQALSCVVFAVFYFVAIPNGGAHGFSRVDNLWRDTLSHGEKIYHTCRWRGRKPGSLERGPKNITEKTKTKSYTIETSHRP